MKVVAVADHFIRVEHYKECFKNYPEYKLTTMFWGSEDRIEMRDLFHQVEKNGPTALPAPQELYTEIEDADCILVLQNGIITEKGNHEELLALGGFYSTLYNSQFA